MPRRKTPIAVPQPPASAPPAPAPSAGKLDLLRGLLTRPEGATVPQMMEATGWQAHSVRSAMAGALKIKRNIVVTSDKSDGVRVYFATATRSDQEGGA